MIYKSKKKKKEFIVPNEFEKETDAFEKLIKKWQPENCPCMLCESYIQNLGFI